MIPGMAGMLPADAMYEGEKKLYIYQQMIDAMEPEERHATPYSFFWIQRGGTWEPRIQYDLRRPNSELARV